MASVSIPKPKNEEIIESLSENSSSLSRESPKRRYNGRFGSSFNRIERHKLIQREIYFERLIQNSKEESIRLYENFNLLFDENGDLKKRVRRLENECKDLKTQVE